ncbi:Cof-type HAD-IIB family hydrolase [Gracilibacillus massiliensis]|uniref:Cof-type HAD-IIB family hydrolase n=1 Tax=Gracilibacillus massiliensis TaxID=1564956 RepID=UPI000AC5FEBA|nr:Cof-type HAD-IIB family hydrolase [Gracilibacillus massiliensis]
MGQKVVFLDIDGTIFNHEKKIPIATKQAVKQLQENGVIVSIATGRAPFMFENLLEELNISTFVSFNGQYVVHDGEVIHQNPIALNQLEAITEFSIKNNHPLVYQSINDMKSSVSDHPHITEGMESLKREFPIVDSEYYKKHTIFQVLLFNGEEEQAIYENAFDHLRFVRWHQYSCDVMPIIGSKAHGIEQFIQAMEIDWKDTYAFGDGLNDVEMIEKVNMGVAMGNSVDEVKAIANYVTDDVDKDGLSKAMKHLSLIE